MDDFLDGQRRVNNYTGLGYNENGESSNQTDKRNAFTTPRSKKLSCNHCGKAGHTSNIYRRKMKGISQTQSTFICNCYKCQKKGHKAHECRSKVINPKRKN